MSALQLSMLKGGINRLRVKGGTDPSSLYDLVNGFVDKNGNAVSRPGTRRVVALPAGTKGLMAFAGSFYVFSNVSTPMADARFKCLVLVSPNDATQPIAAIHFAAPFMGYPYVVAEFGNGEVYHYWLQGAGNASHAWMPNHVYLEGDVVEPTAPNGMAYAASGDDHPPAWKPATKYALGDAVQPTTYNGWQYVLTETAGDAPASGATEPAWLTTEGALVYEDKDSTPSAVTPPSGGGTNPGGGRYNNGLGPKYPGAGVMAPGDDDL